MAGFDVAALEVEQKFLDKGFAGIEKSLAKFAKRLADKGRNRFLKRLPERTNRARVGV